MAGFNQITLLGNLTCDPNLSYLPSQTAVVAFSFATNRRYKGKGDDIKEEVCFVDCAVFGKLAETINKYLVKGSQALIVGRLKFEQWETKEGGKRSKHKVVVEQIQFLGKPKKDAESSPANAEAGDDIPF